MYELSVNEIDCVNGGIAPMLAFYAAYTVLGPAFALGFAHGAAQE